MTGVTAAWAQAEQPEASSGFLMRPALSSSKFMAVTANAHASDAAAEILQLGGNAVDAAIAAQWVLNLVEPQSSGIGGGGFLLHWDAIRREVSAWDGRETAPRNATADFARRADGSLAGFYEVVATGKSVGVPGLVAMLESVHRRHGKLRWERLTRPAIRLAENGFSLSPRLHRLLSEDRWLRQNVAAYALYYQTNGEPRPVGDTLRNPEFAASLRAVAVVGAEALRTGDLATRIVAAVGQRGGQLSAADLRDYQPKQRKAVCGPYRRWRVCGMPPPSSGGVGVLQLLGLMEHTGLPSRDPATADAAHLFAEAGRLTYADRARYLADPDFVFVPQGALLDAKYLGQRARAIDPRRSMGVAQPGDLPARHTQADDNAPELPATTHISIVDWDGNAVAFTSSIESAFGSRIQVGGFLLNNQLTDFSFVAERDGKPVANRLEPGKRPLSSMSPTLVFDGDGRLYAVLGSPGGSRIINYVARTLVALLDGGYEPAKAVAQLHVGNRNGVTEIERGSAADALALELERRGHAVKRDDMTSGLHLVLRVGDRWLGAVDPRREGSARGE
ncbi:MAG: gamma-glutamyltransferase [Burkholderiaceae bacterium]|nr:gamma-glutamyltransferase [Sulfuritalea sp.]MCF8173911.1 gamma-glutamyltransferase [Burkholderiaceae bacterium]